MSEPTRADFAGSEMLRDVMESMWQRVVHHQENLPPSDEFLADLADPIRLEPRAIPWRDKPRRREYPTGG